MATVVYCIAPSHDRAVRICNRLVTEGFLPSDISLIHRDSRSAHEIKISDSSKMPEGAATGAGAGLLFGGALGWAAGIGALAIPGFGPLIAAGPILGFLSGASVGGTLGGLTGALVGAGIPEYEAQQFEGRLKDGSALIAVHASNDDRADRANKIFTDEQAESIWTGSEAAMPDESSGTTRTGMPRTTTHHADPRGLPPTVGPVGVPGSPAPLNETPPHLHSPSGQLPPTVNPYGGPGATATPQRRK